MNPAKPRLRPLHYYAVFTVAFFLFWYLFKLGGTANALAALRSTALDIALDVAGLILTVEYLLRRFFYKGHYTQCALGFTAIVFAGGTVNILGQLWLMHTNILQYHANLARYKEHFYYWFWSDLIAGSYFMVGLISLGGAAITLAFDRARTARKLAEAEAANLSSQLENLHNQLNPHFLFNALNTIYYRIDKTNTAARTLTLQFSSLLRYQLYECNDPEVRIEKELELIENYIDLQKHRAGDALAVTVRGFDSHNGFNIPSHLLMPLVENCFKHVSSFPDKPNFIEVACDRYDHRFEFRTVNSFDPNKNTEKAGIGLAATRKKLDLLSPERYTLDITTNDTRFETILTIPLA